MAEKAVENALRKQLDRDGIYYIKTHGTQFGANDGVPDYQTVINGQAIYFETKAINGKGYPNQYKIAEKLLKQGGWYFFIYPDVEDYDIPLDLFVGKIPKVAYTGDPHQDTPKYTHQLVL